MSLVASLPSAVGQMARDEIVDVEIRRPRYQRVAIQHLDLVHATGEDLLDRDRIRNPSPYSDLDLEEGSAYIFTKPIVHEAALVAHDSSCHALPLKRHVVSTDETFPKAPRYAESKYRDSTTRLAFVFTGQGLQSAGMGTKLLEFPAFAKTINEANACLQRLGADWNLAGQHACFTVVRHFGILADERTEELTKDVSRSRIHDERIAQPATTALQLAMVDLLRSWDVEPVAVCGHSSGEVAAAYAAGVLDVATCMALVYHGGEAVRSLLRAVPMTKAGAMIMIAQDADVVEPLMQSLKRGFVTIACYNGPGNITVAGDHAAIEELKGLLQADRVFCKLLAVSAAYHSDHMLAAGPAYLGAITPALEQLKSAPFRKKVRFYSSVTAGPVDGKTLRSPWYWVANAINPVRFSTAAAAMVTDICPAGTMKDVLVLELSPQPVLGLILTRIVQQLDIRNIRHFECMHLIKQRHEMRRILEHALAKENGPGIFTSYDPCRQCNTGDERLPDANMQPVDIKQEQTRVEISEPLDDETHRVIMHDTAPSKLNLNSKETTQLRQSDCTPTAHTDKLITTSLVQDVNPCKVEWRTCTIGNNDLGQDGTSRVLDVTIASETPASLGLTEMLGRAGHVVHWLCTEHASPADYAIVEGGICIYMNPRLGDMNERTLRSLQCLPRNAQGMLLVTERGASVETYAASSMNFGFARSLRLERPQMKIVVLQLDHAVERCQNIVYDVFHHAFIEQPGLLATNVDYRYFEGQLQTPKICPDEVFARLLSKQEEPGHASCASFQRHSLAAHGVVDGGTYIIIGGLGGIGRYLATWLMHEGARNIVLVSRTGTVDHRLTNLLSLAHEKTVNMQIVTCDVTRADDVRRLHATLAHWPVRGIIHSAMVLESGAFDNLTWDAWHAVVASKTTGLLLLHDIFADESLDFFICLSSMIGVLGLAREAAYAASNAFMDAFCGWRVAHGMPATSLILPAMSDAGVVAETLTHGDKAKTDELFGFSMTAAQLGAVMRAVIQGQVAGHWRGSHLALGLGITPTLARRRVINTAIMREIRVACESRYPPALAQVPHQESTISPDKVQHAVLAEEVRHSFARLLDMPDADIDMHTRIAELSIDSTMAVRLHAWMTRDMGCRLSLLEFIECRTLGDVVQRMQRAGRRV